MDDVKNRTIARVDLAVGSDQIVDLGLPLCPAHRSQSFGRGAAEDIAADPIAREQPRAGIAHRVEALEPHLQAQRQFLRARFDLGIARQQQGGFEIGQPRRHHEIIGRDFELQRAGMSRIGSIASNRPAPSSGRPRVESVNVSITVAPVSPAVAADPITETKAIKP